jgi:hypothetical protein
MRESTQIEAMHQIGVQEAIVHIGSHFFPSSLVYKLYST